MKSVGEDPRNPVQPSDGKQEASGHPSGPVPENGGAPSADPGPLTLQGIHDARDLRSGSLRRCSGIFKARLSQTRNLLRKILRRLDERRADGDSLDEDAVWVLENARLLRTIADQIADELKAFRGPSVFLAAHQEQKLQVPRAFAVATSFLKAMENDFEEPKLEEYLAGYQQQESLRMAELWALKPMLQFVLLERIVAEGPMLSHRRAGPETPGRPADPNGGKAKQAVQSLHRIGDVEWKTFFENNSPTERALREDPSGTYPKMDYESRQLYRDAVEELAIRSLFSEEEVVRHALRLAARARIRLANQDSSRAARRVDLGYYLIDDGSKVLKQRLGYAPSFKRKISEVILEWPEIYYVVGVELTTIALVFLLLGGLERIIPLLAGLLLLIPASHAAVGLVNYLTSLLVLPRRIPRLDFSSGIPSDSTTLVVVPCLLLNEAVVRRNVEALEIRYLGNRDANLHFALLTDPPDASVPFDERDDLVGLCSSLIEQLNLRYGPDKMGGFIHLHRHRVYNPAEGTWMGWERKRGKLIDLNNLLQGTFDSFPVKTGDLSVFRRVRYVITLDADTKLPRETAHRLIGAMAHPLNRAWIDPRSQTVAEGYGILQPRVSVSVESSRNSRLANIYSGQTGFDVYTRAVSDIYQDLFGEGSFTGKGIYDVEVFQKVLGNRFPTNALLSHDLLEGSYARAGLVSEIEVIDDYPSHFSAYCRRLHRWVRGDWQIIRWLLPRVPDFHGRPVANPLAFLSRWKIFDNLRRSLNDMGLFCLLVLGWLLLPGGPVYWTLVTLGLLLLPTYTQLVFSMLRWKTARNRSGFLSERGLDFLNGHLQVFIMLAFLPHQALVMMDAIVRTLLRLAVTRRKLLEWETAAEAETGTRKTPVEIYLALTPWLALGIGILLARFRPGALLVASPVLALWLLADFFARWVNRPLRDQTGELLPEEEAFLRRAGLRTWRFFLEYSNSDNHWLIPDNVQEDPPLVAQRLSPTNLGLLLNARIAALELGFLTLPEYVDQTRRTLESMKELPRLKGHFYNWYDTQTRLPVEPRFLSTVDSGNLVASLWTLKQSCLGMDSTPLLSTQLWRGLRDHIDLLAELSREDSPPAEVGRAVEDLADKTRLLKGDASSWLEALPWLEQQFGRLEQPLRHQDWRPVAPLSASGQHVFWWAAQGAQRVSGIRKLAENFMPWALPEYAFVLSSDRHLEQMTLGSLPSAIADFDRRLGELLENAAGEEARRAAAASLRRRLPACLRNATNLSNSLRQLAESADQFTESMDFGFLYNRRKHVFSIGYDVAAERVESYSYDLLASEARTAVFVAIAKGDASQEAWFHLGRLRTRAEGQSVLLSWSGTMFEYLMPALWMRSVPGTVLEQSVRAAVRCQMRYARRGHFPWGISESAFGDRDAQGTYQYRAFGVPSLAMDQQAPERTVIAPYATFLALAVEPSESVRNLGRMKKMGWQARLGYYDSCDYHAAKKPVLVRTWMAHHQGMTLLALCNLLRNFSIQRWFHRDPRVQATELLLYEKTLLSARVEIEMPRPSRKSPAQANFPEAGVSRSAPHPHTASGATVERTIAGNAPPSPSSEDPPSGDHLAR